MNKVKITVIKTTFDKDIVSKYAKPELGPCSKFQEGQVFWGDVKKPDGFCDTAWNCIYQYVFALVNGGGKDGFFFNDWAKESCMAIACCNDGLRPVIFKLESTNMEVEKDI